MKRILIITFSCVLVFSIFAQKPETLPCYPEFNYISTFQYSEDEYGNRSDYDYIQIEISEKSVTLHSDYWDDTQQINEWVLTFQRKNKNGNYIYKWEGYSPTACAYYSIPAVYFPASKSWAVGYLTEKLCVGVDYTTYRNNISQTHVIHNGKNTTGPIRNAGSSESGRNLD